MRPGYRVAARDQREVGLDEGNHGFDALFAIDSRLQLAAVQLVDGVVESLDQRGLGAEQMIDQRMTAAGALADRRERQLAETTLHDQLSRRLQQLLLAFGAAFPLSAPSVHLLHRRERYTAVKCGTILSV